LVFSPLENGHGVVTIDIIFRDTKNRLYTSHVIANVTQWSVAISTIETQD